MPTALSSKAHAFLFLPRIFLSHLKARNRTAHRTIEQTNDIIQPLSVLLLPHELPVLRYLLRAHANWRTKTVASIKVIEDKDADTPRAS